MKIRLKIKNRLQRYYINWPKPYHVHKYTKYRMCLTAIMIICIKQYLSQIWSLFREIVKQHWGWVEKSVAYIKKVYIHTCGDKLEKYMTKTTWLVSDFFSLQSKLHYVSKLCLTSSCNLFFVHFVNTSNWKYESEVETWRTSLSKNVLRSTSLSEK